MDETQVWKYDAAHTHDRRAQAGIDAALHVTCGRRAGSAVELRGKTVTIGRNPDATLVLDDATVSRHHVEVRPVDEGYELHDLGSINGTYVNGERVDRAVLRPGDELLIGRFCLVFLAGAELTA